MRPSDGGSVFIDENANERTESGLLGEFSPPTWLAALLALALAVLAGVLVFYIGHELFPYLSRNNDEAVYLKQAGLLLDGRLWESTDFPRAFKQWFFVTAGNDIYPRYTPVSAVIFALGLAVDLPRLSLSLVAAIDVLLVVAVVREVFGTRTGLLAGGFVLVSPLFLISSSLFLSYAPTFLFSLLFVLCYLRAYERASILYGVLAGITIGIAFFSRQYSAILFALPFVIHTLVRILWTIRRGEYGRTRTALGRGATIALPGLAFVLLALFYNQLMTGAALTFPFQAYAPTDTIGFGARSIYPDGGSAVQFTFLKGVRSVATMLWLLFSQWFSLGPIGGLFAVLGGLYTIGRLRERNYLSRVAGATGGFEWADDTEKGLAEGTPELLLAGVFVSITLGNVYFWGNYNFLGSAFPITTDAFVRQFGPVYQFDLLLSLSAFAAIGIARFGGLLADRLLELRGRFSLTGVRAIALAVLVVTVPVAAAVEQDSLSGPIDRNTNHTERYESAYEPFAAEDAGGVVPGTENGSERALVFVPETFGQQLSNPFQYLHNDPSLNGSTVYALDRGVSPSFDLLAAKNRTPYRFAYRGEWGVANTTPVEPVLEELSVRTASTATVTTDLGVPRAAVNATIRLENPDGTAISYSTADPSAASTVRWRVTPDGGRILDTGSYTRTSDSETLSLDDSTRLALSVTYSTANATNATYRQELDVESAGEGIRLLWPPKTEYCRLATDCGYEGTYVPVGPDGALPVSGVERDRGLTGANSTVLTDGVSVNATIETTR